MLVKFPTMKWPTFSPLLCLLSYTSSQSIPQINPNFVTNTIELDSANITVVQQRLVFDVDLKRSMMYAEGTLVHGALQQIRRCDIHPQGWMTSAGGEDINDPSTWECTNTTITAKEELPIYCQYDDFWAFPEDMTYQGMDNMNGTTCEKWTYFENDIDEYAVWTTTAFDTLGEEYDVPVANGKIWSNISQSSWTIYYHDFIPGSPDESEFAPVSGSDCPPSTLPTSQFLPQARDYSAFGKSKGTLNM